jgi:hypothetical protein
MFATILSFGVGLISGKRVVRVCEACECIFMNLECRKLTEFTELSYLSIAILFSHEMMAPFLKTIILQDRFEY